MKKRSDFFTQKILPVILTLLIVVSAGGALFAAMNSGFTGLALNGKISEFELPSEAAIYSDTKKKSITSVYPWTKYDEKKALIMTDEVFVDELQGKMDITGAAVTLSAYAMDPENPVIPDFSRTLLQTFDNSYYPIYFLENIGVTLYDGSETKMRMAVCDDGIISYEIDDCESMKRSYTGDEVNSIYEQLKYEALSLRDSYETIYRIVKEENKYYDSDSAGYIVNGRTAVSARDRILSFLCAYSISQSALGISDSFCEDMICYLISSQTPSLTYWDGAIYITWESSFGSLTVKYSLASSSVTGIAVYTDYLSLTGSYDPSQADN